MNNSKAKTVAFLGVIGALIFVVLLVETQVFAVILPVSPCFLSLPLAISLSVYGDYKKMFVGGTVLGVCSFIMSLMFPQFIVFLNPLVSILPRTIFGIVAFAVYKLVSKITKNGKSNFIKETLPLGLSGIFGAITNTVLVVTALYIFKFTGIEDAIATVLSVNALIETVCSCLLVPVIVKTIKKYFNK